MHLYSIRVEPPYVLSQISGQKRQLNVDLADRPTCAVGLRSRKQCLAPCLEFSRDLDEFVANISAPRPASLGILSACCFGDGGTGLRQILVVDYVAFRIPSDFLALACFVGWHSVGVNHESVSRHH